MLYGNTALTKLEKLSGWLFQVSANPNTFERVTNDLLSLIIIQSPLWLLRIKTEKKRKKFTKQVFLQTTQAGLQLANCLLVLHGMV